MAAAAPTGPTGPDDALLALGKGLDAAWTAETAAYEAAGNVMDDHPAMIHALGLNRATFAIVQQIEAATASTFPGLLVKVRAMRWCQADQPPHAGMFDDPWAPPPTSRPTDNKVIVSMLADLYRLSGGVA